MDVTFENLPGEARQRSKICDAADFFDPEYLDVVKNRFLEAPVLHRKQWEFGMIFLTLKKAQMLEDNKRGLSMGSGKEVLLYAVARQVKHLNVTDLYSTESLWECAKTTDPDEFIRKNKPFPVEEDKISAQRMDMRHLAFADCAFDFAYSSCAFEHIGTDDDFLQHLNEVYRVLKDGGVYVLTTEFTCEKETVPIPNNYIFSAEHLDRVIGASKFVPESRFDARLSEQSANFPMPGRVDDLSYRGDVDFGRTLASACVIPHVQLLSGKHHVTSCLLVLKKSQGRQEKKSILFEGLLQSRTFVESCINRYRVMIQKELSLHPFAFIANRTSSYFIPHEQNLKKTADTNTILHTDYYWLGTGIRRILVRMEREEQERQEPCLVEIRVHRIKAAMFGDAAISHCDTFTIPPSGGIHKEITVVADDDHAYAVLALMHRGAARFSDVRIKVLAAEQSVSTGCPAPPVRPLPVPQSSGNMRSAASSTSGWIKRIYSRSKNRVTA